jgi:predicted DNA-binding transcriptional regulator AlpA
MEGDDCMEIDDYVTASEAAEILGKTSGLIWVLCKNGKLPGAKKMGNAAWLIPRASVESYTPGKRGPRTTQERLATELAGIREAIAETKRAEGE